MILLVLPCFLPMFFFIPLQVQLQSCRLQMVQESSLGRWGWLVDGGWMDADEILVESSPWI